jgi:hypothetical protein
MTSPSPTLAATKPIIDTLGVNASTLTYRARKKFADVETLAALRRQQGTLLFAALFLQPVIFIADFATLAAPVRALATNALPLWLAVVAVGAYLGLVYMAIAWQRVPLRGGAFRDYLTSLPLNAAEQARIDERVLLPRLAVFWVPQLVMCILLVRKTPAVAALGVYAVAIFFTAIAAKRMADAALHADARTAVATLLLTLAPLFVREYAIAHVATLVIGSALLWMLPTILARWPTRARKSRMPREFSLDGAAFSLWIQLPFAVLWHRATTAFVVRVIAVSAGFALVTIGIANLGMADRWRGLTATAMGLLVWLSSNWYEPLYEARSTMPLWRAMPLPPRFWCWQDALFVAGIAALLMLPYAGFIMLTIGTTQGFALPLALFVTAIALVAALRGLSVFADAWRVVLAPALAIVWMVIATFAG